MAQNDTLTPDMLYEALVNKKMATAEFLLGAGVEPDQRTLDFAIDQKWTGWVEKLIVAGAKPTADMLFKALCINKDSPTAEILLAHHVVPDQRTLDFAVGQKNWTGWVEKLIDAGAKPTGEMLYNCLCIKKDSPTAEILLAHAAAFDKTDLSREWLSKAVKVCLERGLMDWTKKLLQVIEDTKPAAAKAVPAKTPQNRIMKPR
jgi:hypothetical protein